MTREDHKADDRALPDTLSFPRMPRGIGWVLGVVHLVRLSFGFALVLFGIEFLSGKSAWAALLLIPVGATLIFVTMMKASERLELDRKGFNYRRFWRTWRFSWADLDLVEVDRDKAVRLQWNGERPRFGVVGSNYAAQDEILAADSLGWKAELIVSSMNRFRDRALAEAAT